MQSQTDTVKIKSASIPAHRISTFSLGSGFLLALCIAMLCQHARAQSTPTPAQPTPNFSAPQQKELTHIAARIQVLQTLQSCLQAATDHAGIKACNQTAKQSEHPPHP